MWHRFVALMRLGKVDRVKEDEPVRLVQVREGDLGAYGGAVVAPDLPHVQEFGFTSSPPPGADVVLAASQGDRSRSIVVGTNHGPSRPRDLRPGDACLYDARGARVWLAEDGLVIDGAGLPATVQNVSSLTVTATDEIVLDVPTVRATGGMQIAGELQVTGGATAANLTATDGSVYARDGAIELGSLHDQYHGHTHGGVQTGSGHSAAPDQPD